MLPHFISTACNFQNTKVQFTSTRSYSRGYFRAIRFELGKVFNCYLPEAYWYTYSGPDGTDDPKVWKTTKCYIKSTVFWEYVSYLLFIFYAICKFQAVRTVSARPSSHDSTGWNSGFIYQIGAHVTNVRNWRKSCKMIKYMPLQGLLKLEMYCETARNPTMSPFYVTL